jgi:hypothetical protein
VEPVDSVVLHFFVGSDGELRCRATDIYSRHTWMVRSARAVHELLLPSSIERTVKEVEDDR